MVEASKSEFMNRHLESKNVYAYIRKDHCSMNCQKGATFWGHPVQFNKPFMVP